MEQDGHREKVEWAAGMFGIEHLLDRKPRELSGGERQRVALARAMVREPSVFLLDEPLSNLDAILRASAREELRQFQKRVGVTTIYVTHDQVEAMGLGDRIVVMSQGRIRQVGTPREIYQWPADTFVATFVGSPPMNLIEQGDAHGRLPARDVPPGRLRGRRRGGRSGSRSRSTGVEYLGAERLVYGNVGEKSHALHVVSRLPGNIACPVEVGPHLPLRRAAERPAVLRPADRTADGPGPGMSGPGISTKEPEAFAGGPGIGDGTVPARPESATGKGSWSRPDRPGGPLHRGDDRGARSSSPSSTA